MPQPRSGIYSTTQAQQGTPFADWLTKLGKRVELIGDCWIVDGETDQYHVVSVCGKRLQAHRAVYESIHGDPGPHRNVHHTCENPGCIKPEHLVALTPADHSYEHSIIRWSARPRPDWTKPRS